MPLINSVFKTTLFAAAKPQPLSSVYYLLKLLENLMKLLPEHTRFCHRNTPYAAQHLDGTEMSEINMKFDETAPGILSELDTA